MSGTIQGLSCAACKSAIPADGVTCAACSAPHHWPCFASAGHCASCQAAKAPLPFGVQALRGAGNAWLGAVVVAALLTSCAALGVAFVNLHPGQIPQVLVQAPPAVHQAPPPPPATLGTPQTPGAVRPPVPPAPDPYVRNLKAMLARKGVGDRGMDGRILRYPGRLTGYLADSVLTDRAGDSVLIDLDGSPARAVFLQAEVRPLAGIPAGTALRVEGRSPRADANLPEAWAPMGHVVVPPAGRRWYRFEFGSAVDALRVSLEGKGASVTLHAFAALLLERPKGEVVECARESTVRRLDGKLVVLASSSGQEARVPAELLELPRPEGTVALASPRGTLIARLTRDGNVNVLDPRTNMMRSWGTHISTMSASKHVAWLNEGEEGADAWLNGIGAYTLLERWQPPGVREVSYSPALESAAALNSDGSISVYRPQNNMGGPLSEFDSLEELGAAIAWAQDGEAANRGRAARHRGQAKALTLGLVHSALLPTATRSQRELLRWLRDDVFQRFTKIASPARGPRVGQRVWVSWRHVNSGWGAAGTVQVTMLDREAVLVRPWFERGAPDLPLGQSEFELHRDFLPELPPVRVGQCLWLEPDTGR